MDLREQQILRQIIREELQAILGGQTPVSPAPSLVLDPVRVAMEDRQLLEAQRDLPDNEFKAFRAGIMAKRAEDLGKPTTAAKFRKQANRLMRRAA